jgi:hypothetical protein
MAIRSQFTELMQKDMYAWFLEKYDTYAPVYPQIFQVEQMSSAYEQQTTGLGLGKLSERNEGDSIVSSNLLEGFTAIVKARTFSDSYWMTMEFVEDTPPEKIANILRTYATTWEEGVIASKETFAAKFFIYGGFTSGRHDTFDNTITGVVTDPSGDFIYDGKPFFALTGNNHPAKDGNTYYNSLGALSLTGPNLQTAYNMMTVTNNRNERGEIIQIMPDTLLIPGNLHFTAKTLLESELAPGGANNDKNAVQNIVQPIEWQYLTDTDGWFLGKRQKGLVFYERKSPVIDFYQDEKDKKFYATIDTRFGAGVTNWRYWVASNISVS